MSHMDVPASERVDSPDQVRINGVNYRIEGGVQRFLASTFPQKIVVGDFEEESHPLVSSITWNDLSGGMLKEFGEFPGDENRSYFTNLHTRFKGHVTLGPRADLHGSSLEPYQQVTYSALYRGEIYSIGGTTVFLTNNTSVAQKTVLTSTATDFFAGTAEDRRLLVAPQGERIQWTHSGVDDSVWLSDSSENITHVATWRNLLWGTNDSAELFFAENVSDSTAFSWTRVAQADLTDTGEQQGLMVGPDDMLYLVSKRGLHRYSNATETFDHVMKLPVSADGGAAFVEHQGSIFYAQGLSVWKFTPTGNANIAESVGLDRDGGLPFDRIGSITAMDHNTRDLFVGVRAIDTSAFDGVYAYDGVGWFGLWTAPLKGGKLGNSLVANSTIGADWLFVARTDSAERNTLQQERLEMTSFTTNPSQLGGRFGLFNDDTGAIVIYPWVFSDNEQEWNAISVRAKASWHNPNGTQLADSTDFIAVSCGLNQSSVFTEIGTIRGQSDSNSDVIFTLPNSVNPEGVPFSSIRVKAHLMGGGDHTPDLNQLSISFRKNLDPLWGFNVVIDAADDQKGTSPQEVRENLKALFAEKKLMRFTFKGDAGTHESYLVSPLELQTVEQTGFDDAAQYRLRLAEVN